MNPYRIAPCAALLLRLTLGAAWLSHAFLKLAAFSMPSLAVFLNAQGMPTPMAWPNARCPAPNIRNRALGLAVVLTVAAFPAPFDCPYWSEYSTVFAEANAAG